VSNPSKGLENENPGDRAGSTGADQLTESFQTNEYLFRAEKSISLCLSIANCDPRESVPIMVEAVYSLSAGMPIAPFDGFMVAAEAWAAIAVPPELDAYTLAGFNQMTPKRQAAFLAYVGGAK
jgi:hypothetical protein